MANYEDKPGDITLFKNKTYTEENNQPYLKGFWIKEDGTKCNVACWLRQPKSGGAPFFSGAVEFLPYEQGGGQSLPAKPTQEEIPF